MDINPIRDEADYKNILKEIERLWDSPIGSPEGDRMEMLVSLVEAYDLEHYSVHDIDNPTSDSNVSK